MWKNVLGNYEKLQRGGNTGGKKSLFTLLASAFRMTFRAAVVARESLFVLRGLVRVCLHVMAQAIFALTPKSRHHRKFFMGYNL